MDAGGGAEKYEQELQERDDRFQVKIEELKQKRRQLEQRRETNRARWQQEIAELNRLEHDLDAEEAAMRKQWQPAFLTWPLPVPPGHKDDKNNDNAWELSLMAWMIAVVLSWYLFRMYKRTTWESTLSQRTARLSSDEKLLCLVILLGTCALYLLLRHLDDNSSGASPSPSASHP